MVEKNGKRVPEKDDQFTTYPKSKIKGWVKHPLDEQLRAKAPIKNSKHSSPDDL
jgi:hypothetical protein